MSRGGHEGAAVPADPGSVVARHGTRVGDILRRHGLPVVAPDATWSGSTSDVVGCGDVVVKLARARPDAVEALRTDVTVNRVVAGLGVPVPAVLAHAVDGDGAHAVLERVPGRTLEECGRTSAGLRSAWEEVGRCLALVHEVRPGTIGALDGLHRFRQTPQNDPRRWLEFLARAGLVGRTVRDLARRELDLAAGAVLVVDPTLCHGDLNATNVVRRHDPRGVTGPAGVTLLDWAGAGWLDPVWDLAAVPVGAVPHLLAGHRERRPFPHDGTAVDRLTWVRLQLVLRRALDGAADVERRREAVEHEVTELLDARHGEWSG